MMDKKNAYVVIMAGGIGSRFWPLSKRSQPKQFIDFMGTGKSLIRHTYERFAREFDAANIYVVTNREYAAQVREHIPELGPEQVLEEPSSKNTAPCVAFASYHIHSRNPDAVCVVAPSDHLILDETRFLEHIGEALTFAAGSHVLCTLGITPTRPDTGYGYIQYNTKPAAGKFHKVRLFTEKPSAEIAQTFMDSGEFLWNSGIFIWKAASVIREFEQHLEDVAEHFRALGEPGAGFPTAEQMDQIYSLTRSISIDYGILEQSGHVYVMPASFGWSDLGTWKSLHDISPKNEFNTSVIGKKVMTYESADSLVFNNSGRLIVLKGVDNLVVVDSGDVLLILDKDHEQEIRQVVADVRDAFKEKYS
jgi:mannose-1-phosphate guanylyltransferase